LRTGVVFAAQSDVIIVIIVRPNLLELKDFSQTVLTQRRRVRWTPPTPYLRVTYD
jgi:hypothetical protein